MAMYKGAASEAGRALQLQKKREKAKEELEMRKKKIEEELKLSSIDNKFAAHYDAIEAQLKSSTIGLVSLNEMKAKQEDFVKERERKLVQKNEQMKLKEIEEKKQQKERQKKQIQTLSFKFDEEEEEEDEEGAGEEKDRESDRKDEPISKSNDETSRKPDTIISEDECSIDKSISKTNYDSQSEDSSSNLSQPRKKKKIMKNPEVDTSFLPDRDREEEEKKLREELRQEWVKQQEKIKNEDIEITFSFWDGSGHRRSVKMKKGNTIYQFLQKTLELLRKEFHELRAVAADQLMYVKEDLIIPHHYTFYDFIVTKARGKSGPLFNFDVHEDIRLLADATVEKDESHAGKVLMRSWYERNKHIFPASRWEPYDPSKNYEKYTISDKK
ncbi:protein FAM50A-A [Tetranychus urticae]|uniref:protein FAM50A-A n=1 Tax=Tetranychus urticae TaxID=32264 RepID=UPI0003561D91|nr:protein FAM50A-A [Tetranychus urticae]